MPCGEAVPLAQARLSECARIGPGTDRATLGPARSRTGDVGGFRPTTAGLAVGVDLYLSRWKSIDHRAFFRWTSRPIETPSESYMNCPVDGSELRITERQGIEIDYCPQCRGVWLDRGELDKVLERSAQPAYRDERERSAPPPFRDERDRYDDDRSYRGQDSGRKSKRRSFLEDLLDFD
jgi:uncharacterized protein